MRPAREFVQAAEPRHALGARPQHQVIGVAEDDVGAERRAPGPYTCAFTVPPVPTGMKAGVRIVPRGMEISPRRALPSVAIRRKPIEFRRDGASAPASSDCVADAAAHEFGHGGRDRGLRHSPQAGDASKSWP